MQIIKHDIIIPTGKVLIQLQNVHTGKIRQGLCDNMVVTAGKNAIADALRGTTANTKGIITYCAVGTGSTAPALADIAMQTELARKLISVRTVDGKTAVFQTFFTTSEGNGTLREAGLFGDDASATSGSGTLFCRVAISRTKTSSDTLTITWNVTIG